MIAVRLPELPTELVTAHRRIAELERENDVLAEKLEITQRALSTRLDDLAELRRHRAALVRAVRNRSSMNLPADLVALIEEEALGE